MNCLNCGTPMPEDASFCNLCGTIRERAHSDEALLSGAAQAAKPPDQNSGKWYRKPWIYIAAALAVIGIAAAIVTGGAAALVTAVFGPPDVILIFEDQNLENAVREQLDIWERDIIEKDTQGIEILDLKDKGISEIGTLAAFVDLTHLNLSGNRISDIGALSALTGLQQLALDGNQIGDIGALSELVGLQQLALDGNQIGDIGALTALANLNDLSLSNNLISDISSLKRLTGIESLCLNNNQITDLAPLDDLKELKQLQIDDNQISDISALSGCTKIKELTVKNNPLKSIGVAAHLEALEYINIEKTYVDDVSAVAGKVRIDIGNLQRIRLDLDLGEYFMLSDIKLPVDVGDAAIGWTSSDQEVVSIEEGKVQVTNVQDYVYSEYYRHCTLSGEVEKSDIVFTLEIIVSHGSYFLDVDAKKTKYKSGNYTTTGYCYVVDPKIENIVGMDLEYDINVSKGKLEKFTLRAYINDGKWKNFGSINMKSGASGMLHVDFEQAVSLSKYWIVPTDKKSGQWNDFSYIDKIYYAYREADIEAAQQGAVPEAKPA